MAGKQAKILSRQAVEDLLFLAETTRHPERNRVIVLLTVKAGLRAGEIANLTWEMIETPTGGIGTSIEMTASSIVVWAAVPTRRQDSTAAHLIRVVVPS